MVASVIDTSAYNWGIHSKFSFEVGLENPFFNTSENYGAAPQIIWFKQGLYICTSYSSSISTSGYTINLQGKDKMCLLNGDVGGALPALSTSFDKREDIKYTYEPIDLPSEMWRPGAYYIASGDNYILDESPIGGWQDDRTYYSRKAESEITKIWIGDIVKELVHVYGNEPYHNIIIQDIEANGVELWEYIGDKTMYMLIRCSTNEVENLMLDDETKVYRAHREGDKVIREDEPVALYTLAQDQSFKFLVLNTLDTGTSLEDSGFSIIADPYNDNDCFFLMKFNYGDLIGYHATPLVYPGDLKGNVGASITSILDNITKTFGNYEYFYDLDGHFIFQKKRAQIQTEALGLAVVSQRQSAHGLSGVLKSDVRFDTELMAQLQSYNYQNSELFTQMSITPQITKIKNDYSIWGTRPSVNDTTVPVHYRFAISEKPKRYTSIRPDGATYESTDLAGAKGYDWRELIYQMAEDYYLYNQDDNFLARIAKANPDDYPTGYTGYEMFYQDMQAFWRQIYLPEDEWVMERVEVTKEDFAQRKQELYTVNTLNLTANYIRVGDAETWDSTKTYYCPTKQKNQTDSKWHKNVFDNPTSINYWLDFCDSGELSKFSIQHLGDRAKAINDTKVKSIYYEEAPNVLFVYTDEAYDRTMTGYTPLLINRSMEEMFKVSSMGKNAKEALTTLLNDNAFISESVSITSIPIYYLDVNTKIKIVDNERGISGDYLVNKLTIPLTYNGTMNITATKVIKGIY